MEAIKQWWDSHSMDVLVWLVAWPLMLALLVTRFIWSGLEPALKVMQEDAWRRTVEDNRAYEEWSAEQLEVRFKLKREDEAKMHAVLERVRARHAESMSKLATYKMQRQTAINLMKEEAARIRARIVAEGGAPASQPAAPVQVDPTRPAANDAPLSTTPQAA